MLVGNCWRLSNKTTEVEKPIKLQNDKKMSTQKNGNMRNTACYEKQHCRQRNIAKYTKKKCNFLNLPQPLIRYPNLIYLSGLI